MPSCPRLGASPSLPEQGGEGKAGARPSAAPGRAISGLAQGAPRGHGDDPERTEANHAGFCPGLRRNAGLCRRSPQRFRPHQRQRRARRRARKRRSRCSTPASCSATASGRVCGLSTGGSRSSTAISTGCGTARKCCASTSASAGRSLKTRLFDVIDANGMTDGVHIRLMVTRGVKTLALSGPAPDDRRRDDRHHSGMEAAAAGNVRARGHAVHRAHPPHRVRPSRTRSSTRIPSSTASSPASRRWRRARTRR